MNTKKNFIKGKQKKAAIELNASATLRKLAIEVESGTVTIDARSGKDRRASVDRRQQDMPVAVERRQLQRRTKVTRRRQIDPTTCERDYSVEEIEFMGALDDYKRRSGRMFPTCSEVLEVLKGLGYEKQPATPAPVAVAEEATTQWIGAEQVV
jgi:hypothetical protein